MWRNAFFAAVLGLLVACSQSETSSDGAFGGGQGGAPSSSSTTNGTGGGASASSTTGAGGVSLALCDDAMACGDYVSGCTGCAVSTMCAEVYDGCFGDDTCLEFNKCLAGCANDMACREQCATANPVGADRYNALVTCIVCQVCPKSCADFASFCP